MSHSLQRACQNMGCHLISAVLVLQILLITRGVLILMIMYIKKQQWTSSYTQTSAASLASLVWLYCSE